MSSLVKILSEIVGQAFVDLGLPVELGRVQVSDRQDLAQFQCNGAMAAAKLAKKAPRDIAQDVLAILQENELFDMLDLAGPGFINMTVKDEVLNSTLEHMNDDVRLSVPHFSNGETMVLDYGGPNVAKPMHVGHLRASIIGDSLRRIAKFAGYKTIGDVHMGDWGTQMGMIISELERRYPDWNYFDESYTGPYPAPAESPVSMEDLEEIYPTASAACKADADRMEDARLATVALQNKRPGYYALWQHFMAVSIESMKGNFDALGVHFDLWKGESDVQDIIPPMVEELKKKSFAVESDGALVVPVKKNSDSKEFPPLILLKSDGAAMYGTTDLATIVERVADYKPAKIVYVVDQRQHLHFEQVFRAARLSNIAPEGTVDLTHAGFGTMNGQDGKPFKTREGGVMKLEDLIDMGLEKARARLAEADLAKDADEQEREDIAYRIAIAAIKFADLQNNRTADYVFDLDRLTSFEGKTGPYLLYQAVRIKSLLNKADYMPQQRDSILIEDVDRPLALLLTQIPEVIELAIRNYTPHVICDYVYKIAQEFSSFYAKCHILSEDDEALRNSRLALCALTYAQIELLLGLLGIKIPERM